RRSSTSCGASRGMGMEPTEGPGKKPLMEVVLSGFGGQGVIKAGQILGRAVAIHEGRNAVMGQSYGPESRGGACKTEVIIADGEIAYPRVVAPDIAVVLSQEAYRQVGLGRPADCLLIAEEDLVQVDAEAERGRRVARVPATKLAEQLGRRIVLNIVTLGFLCGTTGIVSADALKKTIVESVPKGTEQLNLRAFEAGYEYARRFADQERKERP
ncbi:MAG TPA: 2-oxoacid:acceptor oxidoreductase family protein, partial [Acidimicrobiales bacterium]|nr:2-oxoacid:acceptor oxidoreductase family protein [Acidimicrobiales bacterium]